MGALLKLIKEIYMKKIIVAMMLMFTTNAGLLVEPYLGYDIGKFSTEISGTEFEWTTNGPVVGGRLGYTFLTFMAGVDYSITTLDAEIDTAGYTSTLSDFDGNHLGIFAGVELPVLLRAWATYFLSSKLTDNDDDEYDGSGFGLGVGFTGLPFVSLNLEYRSMTYDEFTDVSAGTTSTDRDYDVSEILFTVSLPLDL